MAGINEQGLTTKRFEEIKNELELALISYFGNNIDVSENSILGVLNTIYANAITEQWEMSEAVYNAFNIDVATGKQLDDLVALVGLNRLAEAKTTGLIEFTGVDGTVIPIGTEVKTSDTDTSVFTDEALTISTTDCSKAQVTLASVVDGTSYVVNVNGTAYSHTADGLDTPDTVMASLVDSINFDVNASWSANVTVGMGYFTIEANAVSFPMTVIVGAGLGFGNITSVVQATVTEEGEVLIFENTVTVIVSPITGLNSANNSLAFDTGRLQESDDDLRLRQSVSTSVIGSSSRQAIEAQLRNIQGVTFARVIENTSIFTDERGLPAKSFESIVEGSTDDIIAEAIYTIKPAGIETYGNRVVSTNGQAIFFTRPTNVVYHINVNYTLYDEEVFPPNGVDLIRQAVLTHSQTLDLGEDVIDQRFYGEIFRSVEGIQSLDITLGYDSFNVTEKILPINETSRGLLIEDNITITLGV